MLDHCNDDVASSRATAMAPTSARPRRSSGLASAMASAGTRFQPAAAAAAATGRLAAKTALQPSVLTSTAASAGPLTPTTPHTDATRA